MSKELTIKGIAEWIEKSQDFLHIVFEDRKDYAISPTAIKRITKIKERDGAYGDFLPCYNDTEVRKGTWSYDDVITTNKEMKEIEKLIKIHNKKIFKKNYE